MRSPSRSGASAPLSSLAPLRKVPFEEQSCRVVGKRESGVSSPRKRLGGHATMSLAGSPICQGVVPEWLNQRCLSGGSLCRYTSSCCFQPQPQAPPRRLFNSAPPPAVRTSSMGGACSVPRFTQQCSRETRPSGTSTNVAALCRRTAVMFSSCSPVLRGEAALRERGQRRGGTLSRQGVRLRLPMARSKAQSSSYRVSVAPAAAQGHGRALSKTLLYSQGLRRPVCGEMAA